jgi:hypothetical protein
MTAAVYTCGVCGRSDHWGKGWSWWPGPIESPWTDPTPQLIVCSPTCQAQAPNGRVRR